MFKDHRVVWSVLHSIFGMFPDERWENLIKISSSKITFSAHFLTPASFSSVTLVERVTCQFWMLNLACFCVRTFSFIYSQNTVLANLFDTSLVSIWNMDRTSLNLALPIVMLYINHFQVCSLFLHHYCFFWEHTF